MATKVFISHASEDKNSATRIAEAIQDAGGKVWFDEFELKPGDSIKETIEAGLRSSDLMVLLLSPSAIKSDWVKLEWDYALNRQLRQRNISVVPVKVEECEIPPQLANRKHLDLTTDPQRGIDKLVELLEHTQEVDFGVLSAATFENLIADLLDELGFTDVMRDQKIGSLHVDFEANFRSRDPFDGEADDRWIIEAKLYREKRFSIAALDQIIDHLSTLPRRYRGLLITNGHLTSQAAKFLKDASDRVDLRVIDGLELRSIVLRYSNLVAKYFEATGS